MSDDFDATVVEKLVWCSIEQFDRDHLLEEQVELPTYITTGMNGGRWRCAWGNL